MEVQNSKFQILWLSQNYFPNRGGMAQSCDRITQNLRDLGANIHIIHFRANQKHFKRENVLGGTYLACPVGEDSSHSLNMLWNFLSQQKNKINYTHIVAFGGHLPILAAPIFAKWLAIPLLTMIRGNDFDMGIFSSKRREMLLYCLNQSKEVIAISKDKALKIRTLVTKNTRVSYVANGIDVEGWQALKSNLKNAEKWRAKHVKKEEKVIGFFGDLKAKKGLDFFVESILKSTKKEQIHLMIVGQIPDKTQDWLIECEISFTLIPFLDRFELLSYYPACDVVAIPSFYDGMPNVLLEAGALGLPFLASQVDGMKDFIIDGEHGFLFYPNDLEMCSRKISNFINSEHKELMQMGQNCKELIQKKYTQEQESESYLQIFERSLS